MRNGLQIKLNDVVYRFTDGGTVEREEDSVAVGRWHAHADLPKCHNCLLYDLDGVEQKPLKANYKFNENNQLVVTVADDNPAVARTVAEVFPGQIRIDDQRDIEYVLLGSDGNPTGQTITLYGDLRFDTPFRLVIDLANGGQAMIRADDLPMPVEANQAVAFWNTDGADRLDFRASTVNRWGGDTDGETHVVPAEIGFDGEWRLEKDGLKFVCSGSGDLAERRVSLGLAGKYKAVSGGLEVVWDSAEGASARLLIEGQHTFDAGSASWTVAIGYTQLADRSRALTARVAGKFTHKTKGGNEFTIAGRLEVESDDGSSLKLDMGLDATYSFKGGKITFAAVVNWGGGQISYDLRLAGTLQFQKGKLTFAVRYGADNTVSLEVNYEGSSESFLKNFGLKFKRDSKGRIQFEVSFRIEFTYVNGVLIGKPLEKLLADN